MRKGLALFIVLTTTSLIGCGKKPDDGAAGTKTAAQNVQADTPVAQAIAARAEGGGQLVQVGRSFVEVRAYKDGNAEAFVYDEAGTRIAEPEKVKLVANAQAGGKAQPIELTWQPAIARFAGKAQGDVELTAAPIDLELTMGGAAAKGRLETPVLLVGPEIGGTLAVVGKYGVELVMRADGIIEAIVRDAAGARIDGDAAAKIDVKVPSADGTLHAIALAWDGPKARFSGRADAAAKLAAGLPEVSINGDAAVRLPRVALAAQAKHKGRVVVVGDYSVELVADGDVVQAYVFDASGAAATNATLDLSLRLGTGAFVGLVWDAPSLSYRVKLDKKIDLDVAPLTIGVKGNGKAFVGASAPRVNLNADAKTDVKTDVDAKLSAAAKAKAKVEADAKSKAKPALEAKANVKAPSVSVTPPKVDVNVKGGFSLGK